jgi:hypothetical protein
VLIRAVCCGAPHNSTLEHMFGAPSQDVERSFRTFVQQWFRVLADGQWSAAIAMLDEPNSYGVRWSEVQIRNALDEYSSGAKVSDPANVKGKVPRASSGKFDDGSGYWFDHSVPLNGAWSDLTAQFEFKRRGEQYAVILHDLHVL